MIDRAELRLPPGVATTIAPGLEVLATPDVGERPATLRVRRGERELDLAGFAGLRHHAAAGKLQPACEVVRWGGLTVLVGLTAVVIISPRRLDPVDLHRKPDDDNGFHDFRWLEPGPHLIAIYEGGIFALDASSEVLWHVAKSWDDILDQVDGSGLHLVGHEQDYLLDPADGSRRE